MTKLYVVRDPALAQLFRELKAAVATGRMTKRYALDAMRQAIRRAVDQRPAEGPTAPN